MTTTEILAADDGLIYEVEYTNEFDTFVMSAEFSRVQAAQMVATLFRLPSWGRVTQATVRKTDRKRDMRSIEEIEQNVIA
jgi:hypothetical protein